MPKRSRGARAVTARGSRPHLGATPALSLAQQFPNPNDYSEFMGAFSSTAGACTLGMMLLGRKIFDKFGWGVAALVTPSLLMLTGEPRHLSAIVACRRRLVVARLPMPSP